MTYLAVKSDDSKSEQIVKTLFNTISTLKDMDDKKLEIIESIILMCWG